VSGSRDSLPISGLERLCAGLSGSAACPLDRDLTSRLRRAAGLLTHPAAVTRDLTHAVDALLRAGARLVALFGPEHGVRGEAADGRAVGGNIVARWGLPVHSLYRGSDPASHSLDPELLRDLEVLLVDLQDVGARFYTYASTVSLCMQAAQIAGVPIVILDRPNPIGPAVEGPLPRPEFSSFVGLHPVPVRHGCTLGELALLFHRAFGVGAEPFVVSARVGDGTRGEEGGPSLPYALLPTSDTLPWVPPSPNIPTPLTALVYPGTGLLEGTNVSEGRGTARPFEWLGAPWVEADRLAERLQDEQLPGVAFRPIHFTPSASKWAGEVCGGVHLHVLDPVAFLPVRTGVAILAAVRALWPDRFAWRETGGRYFLDSLAGTDAVRLAIDAGAPAAEIAATWQADEASFRRTRESHLVYSRFTEATE
jgi:uncharacterized protein YbbC (DUF1343 family)